MRSVEDLLQSDALEGSRAPAVHALTLPRECYISSDFHQFELETIWRRQWVCVGRTSQIPNVGDYFTVTVGDDPLIIVREDSTTIRAMSAVCRHRAMVIADGTGHCERLTCGYHGWQYDRSGRLISAPAMGRTADFIRSEVRLPSIAVNIWHNFVFVNFQSDAAPLDERLTELEPIIGNYALDSLSATEPAVDRFDYNWKVFMENAMECYHCTHLHPVQHDCAPSNNTQPELLPDHPSVVVVSVTTTHRDASFVPPDYLACFPPLPGLSPADRHQMHWIGVLPNLLMGFYPDSVQYVVLLPDGPERTRMEFGWLFPPEVMSSPGFAETFDHQNNVIAPMLQQDFDACSRVQRGLHASLAERGRLSWQEETFNHLDRWLVGCYKGGARP